MFKISVKELINEKRKIIETNYFPEEITLHTGNYKVIAPGFKVRLVLTYTENKILLGGYARGYVERQCDRCLEISKMYIDGVVEAVYTFEKKESKQKEELKDLTNEIYLNEETIDLEERIIEGLVSSAPNVFVCSPDCKGLCPYCGENLNLHADHTCAGLEKSKVDPRFEILRKLAGNN